MLSITHMPMYKHICLIVIYILSFHHILRAMFVDLIHILRAMFVDLIHISSAVHWLTLNGLGEAWNDLYFGGSIIRTCNLLKIMIGISLFKDHLKGPPKKAKEKNNRCH